MGGKDGWSLQDYPYRSATTETMARLSMGAPILKSQRYPDLAVIPVKSVQNARR